MTATGYTRQSAGTIVTSNTIQASDFNNEYNQLQSAFDGTSGHDHSGGSGLSQKISLTAAVSGILPTANGGTGIAYFTAAGPTVARVYTFPDANSTMLTSNAAVTVAQGGTGVATLTSGAVVLGNGVSAVTTVAPGTSGNILMDNGTAWATAAQTSITKVGTITQGVWNGTAISLTASVSGILPAANGGTGINNSNTITLGGNVSTAGALTLSGAFGTTITVTALTSVTLPTSGTLVNTAVTTLGSLTTASSLTSIGTIGTGVWQGTAVGAAYGGTGVANNAANTVTFSGNFALTFTLTNTTSVTLPTSGTLCTTLGSSSIATVGTVTAGTWNATPVTVTYGGTGAASFTAYSVLCGGTTGTGTLQNVSGVGTSGQVLTSNGAAALPSWKTGGGSYKVGSFNYDVSTASGTLAITGVGFTPKEVDFLGFFTSGGNAGAMSWGSDDGVTPFGVANTSSLVFAPNDGGGNSISMIVSGGNGATALITAFGADGFTLTWTKTGSPTGTAKIIYTARA